MDTTVSALSASKGLKARIVIGNIMCKKSYNPEDKAFHSTDIPDEARKARLQTKRWKKPDTFGRPMWCAETLVGQVLCDRVSSQLIDTSKRDPKPDYSMHGWNPSTQSISVKETISKEAQAMETALRHSKSVASVLCDYRPPHVRAADVIIAPRTVDTSPVRLPVPGKSTKFKASSSRRFKTYTHSGTYCQTRFERCHIWSCCLSTDPLAEGCIVSTINPDAYNFASIA